MNLKQTRSLLRALLILLVITMTGCAKNSNIIDEKLIPVQIQEQKIENEATTSNIEENEKLIKKTVIEGFDKLGITIQMPENENWIGNPTYSIIDEAIAQVEYYDKIAKTDVTLRASKVDIQTLLGKRYSFDDEREEIWYATISKNGKHIDIKVQYAISDKEVKGVLVSWNYNEFNYTLWANISDERVDASPIAKTARYIASKMR